MEFAGDRKIIDNYIIWQILKTNEIKKLMGNTQDNSNEAFRNFVEKYLEKILLFRKASVLILLIGVLLNILEQSISKPILIIGSISTAIIYYLLVYKKHEKHVIESTNILNSEGFIDFIRRLQKLSISASAAAMLGLVINFKNHNPMLICGGITLIIVLILSLIIPLKERYSIYNSTFYIEIIVSLIFLIYLGMVEYHIMP
ncbi:MAG: hypothetical protein JXB49_27185 [Bacteroidales bacterium]|nr:hypothetical protein [Bacteroidales bacterium]